MKQYLLPQNGNDYKANLHCHSTLSDGSLTPEQIKDAYKEQGYAIVAYTDHDIMIDHSDLADENFLPLRGYEMEINEEKSRPHPRKTCHMCLIAIEPDNFKQVCWHRERYLFGNAPEYKELVQFDESLPDYVREYSVEGISEMMQMGRDNGFFVTYNHPGWSLENYEQYANYRGMHAMEICNYGCYEMGYEDYNPKVYDDILRTGNRIFCIAADDNHNRTAAGNPWSHDSFGGFTVIRADRLDYRTVTRALEQGNFYASMGPEIHELYIEDNKVHITCSPAKHIRLHCGARHSRQIHAEDGKYLTEATFELHPETDIFFRLSVENEKGLRANTNAYFCDALTWNESL